MDAEASNEQREDETSAFVPEVDRTKPLARTPPSPWRRKSRPTTRLERSCQRRCGTTCSCTGRECTVSVQRSEEGEKEPCQFHRFLLAASPVERSETE